MDSLRYWLTEMRVDGFRFDLAPSLARQEGGFDQVSAFFDLVSQDPVVGQAKLVRRAVGRRARPTATQLGPLPSAVAGVERQVPRHDARLLAQPRRPARRVRRSGSPAPSDLFASRGRRPTASVNLITVHDGFTLADLVSYDSKHNEANGEANRDGTDDNRSWNCGAEGPTADPDILGLRARQRRAMLTTLLLSFGVPLLLGGDELGRTQQGNNNAYCQDNAITWFDWSDVDADLLTFTKRLVALRRAHPVFRRRRFLAGAEASRAGLVHARRDRHDRRPTGPTPTPGASALYLDGADDPDRAADGSALVDDDFLVLVNAWWEPLDFVIPSTRPGQTWYGEIDTFDLRTVPGLATHGRRRHGDGRPPIGRRPLRPGGGRRQGSSHRQVTLLRDLPGAAAADDPGALALLRASRERRGPGGAVLPSAARPCLDHRSRSSCCWLRA